MVENKTIETKETSDYSKIRVTSNGAFYMRSEDIFDNKQKSLQLLNKLSEALEKYDSKKSDGSKESK